MFTTIGTLMLALGAACSTPGEAEQLLLTSLEQSSALPNACTSCGRCAEVCPADIPIPDLLRDLRHEENAKKLSSSRWRLGMKLHGWLALHPRLYHTLTGLGIWLLHLAGRKSGKFTRLPMAAGWTSQRDFPAPQGKTFMRQLAAATRKSEKGKSGTPKSGLQKSGSRKPGAPRPKTRKPGKPGAPRSGVRRPAPGQPGQRRIEPSLGEPLPPDAPRAPTTGSGKSTDD